MMKPILRQAYRAATGLRSLAARPGGGTPRVFYGGARSGDVGGPLVKVKRLKAHFPEQPFGFNLVYALSGASYLPASALALLKRRGVALVANQNGVFYPAWYEGDWRAMNAEMAAAYHLADHVAVAASPVGKCTVPPRKRKAPRCQRRKKQKVAWTLNHDIILGIVQK